MACDDYQVLDYIQNGKRYVRIYCNSCASYGSKMPDKESALAKWKKVHGTN